MFSLSDGDVAMLHITRSSHEIIRFRVCFSSLAIDNANEMHTSQHVQSALDPINNFEIIETADTTEDAFQSMSSVFELNE